MDSSPVGRKSLPKSMNNRSIKDFIPHQKTPLGFSQNEIFHGKIEKYKGNVITPSSVKPVIVMNPSTTKRLTVVKGGLVIVGNKSHQEIFRCWPSSTVSQSTVTFAQRNMFKHDFKKSVTVCSYTKHGKLIDFALEMKVSVKNSKPFMFTKEFSTFLLTNYDKFFVKEQMVLVFSYYGTLVEVKIEEIKGFSCENNEDEISNSENNEDEISNNEKPENDSRNFDLAEICEDISNLNLEETSTKERQQILNCSLDNFDKSANSSMKCSTPIANKDRKNCDSEPRCDIFPSLEDIRKLKFFRLGLSTKLCIFDYSDPKKTILEQKVSLCDIFGLDIQISTLKILLEVYLDPSGSNKKGKKLPKSILIYGPTGTGKSLIVKAICNESKFTVSVLNCSDIYNYEDNSNLHLRKHFQNAKLQDPSIVILEDIDLICRKNENSETKLLFNGLPKLIDDLVNSTRIVVIATAKKLEKVYSTLRFEREISLNVPVPKDRIKILGKLLENATHSLSLEQIENISNSAHGFSGSDLKILCNKAYLTASFRNESKNDPEITITYSDFIDSLRNVKPTSMKEFSFEIPKVYWKDIGGMHQVKEEISDMVDLPLKNPEAFFNCGIKPSRGILMYGPPGCSKTMIAKALATESQLNFIAIKGPELFSKYVGESEKAVNDLFKKARASAPCIIFFDEIDSLAAERQSGTEGSKVGQRVLTQLLTELDGIDVLQGVCIIAATNRPDLIDPGLLRPGRFDRILYVPMPDSCTREEIFKIKLSNIPKNDDINVYELVQSTEGYTGAEIDAVCQEAAMQVILKDVKSTSSVISMQDLRNALSIIRPRTSRHLITFYELYKQKYHRL